MPPVVNGADSSFPSRSNALDSQAQHFFNGRRIKPPFPDETERVLFAMGCFWGAERLFWEFDGVYSTAVGYSAGASANPTYEEVCSGLTGHAEAVLVVFHPEQVEYDRLLRLFWESHDPTQGMRQGADVGTQYRSGIYTFDEGHLETALESRRRYQPLLNNAGYGNITTEISLAGEFFYAEDYHQQYLAKNPNGYCGLGGTGVACGTRIAPS